MSQSRCNSMIYLLYRGANLTNILGRGIRSICHKHTKKKTLIMKADFEEILLLFLWPEKDFDC